MHYYNHDLQVGGALTATNIAEGTVNITIAASGTRNQAVTFPNGALGGTGTVHVFVTALSTVPGTVAEVSVSSVTATGFTAYIHRTTAVNTIVHWFAYRKPS